MESGQTPPRWHLRAELLPSPPPETGFISGKASAALCLLRAKLIPYDYTVEVTNRFKGLDLINRVPEELWMEVHDIVQETGIKTIPMEKKRKK